MSSQIEIKNVFDERVGCIDFNEGLSAHRTATGFSLSMPTKITLKSVAKNDPMPMISSLRGIICASDTSNNTVEVGQILQHPSESAHKSGYSDKPNIETSRQSYLYWRGALCELACFEKIRG